MSRRRMTGRRRDGPHRHRPSRFKPDPEMFEDTVYDYETLHKRMREQAFLNAGLRITLTDQRGAGASERVHVLRGRHPRASWSTSTRTRRPLHPDVIYLSGEQRRLHGRGRACSTTTAITRRSSRFANNIHTAGGRHARDGLQGGAHPRAQRLRPQVQASSRRATTTSPARTCREGLTAVISRQAHRGRSSRGRPRPSWATPRCARWWTAWCIDKLSQFLEENPAVGRARSSNKALTASRAREAARKARESYPPQERRWRRIHMPGKLRRLQRARPVAAPRSTSSRATRAGGSAKQGPRLAASRPFCRSGARCSTWRRPAPTRSTATTSSRPSSRRWAPALGDEFDISKLRYHKVIIMADADVDGSHIRTLLLTFFFRFMRPLIDERLCLHRASPPLYQARPRQDDARTPISDEERDKISRRDARRQPEREDRHQPLQGPRRDGPARALGDDHGPRDPHAH